MLENKNIIVKAILYSAEPPSDNQKEELTSFLKDKYNKDIILSWKKIVS